MFAVPTKIIMVIAPINAALNYLLGLFIQFPRFSALMLCKVWGPKPFALGFIGAPLASAISINIIAISSVVYGSFFVPKTAWHPIGV